MAYLSWLLMRFEACSGLRINLEKSELIPVGRVHNIEDLVLKLGCKVGGLPSNYLGLLLGATFKSVWCGMVLKRDSKKASNVEKTVYLKRRKNHFNSKHFV